MKFFDIKTFTGDGIEQVVAYLKERLNQGLRDLYTGLRKLDFSNNFSSFDWTGDIAAGVTVAVANPFNGIPRARLVTRCIPFTAGTVIIDDSLTPWTEKSLYLRNSGTVKGRVTVVFFE